MHAELHYGMLCASAGVIDPANWTFQMRLRVVPGHRLDTPLEFRAVFSKIVPQPGHLRPIPATELTRAFCRTSSHTAQVFAKIVRNERFTVLANMCHVPDIFVLTEVFHNLLTTLIGHSDGGILHHLIASSVIKIGCHGSIPTPHAMELTTTL